MNRLDLLRLMRNLYKSFKNIDTEASVEFGISPIEFEIITLIAEYEDCKTAKDIGQAGDISEHAVSVHIKKLRDEGYLVRRPVKGNRRKTAFALTDKAKPIAERGREIHRQTMTYLYDGLTPEEISTLEKGLSVINYNALRLS